MSCYSIKTKEIEKETDEYANYDWEAFSNLTLEEKVAEYLKISSMLLMYRRSRHFYLQKITELLNNDKFERRKNHFIRIVLLLANLIDILECVVNQMELQIVLL